MNIVWLDDKKVDWQRNELHLNNGCITLEPKVASVLKALVSAKGEIVSHDQLLNLVWPNSIVAPNALQRCIAQIRKLFDDTAKLQNVIKTHPKLGYSFVAKIEYRKNTTNQERKIQPKHSPKKNTTSNTKVLCIILSFSLLVVCSIIFLNNYNNQSLSIHSYTKLNPITSSIDSEFGVALSPDEKKLAFIREYVAKSKRQGIVIADRLTSKEIVLPTSEKFNGPLSFNSTGNIVYFSRIRFADKVKCSDLVSVNLSNFIEKTLLSCRRYFNHSIKAVNHRYYLFQQTDKAHKNKLMFLDTDTSATHSLKLKNQHSELINWDYQATTKTLIYLHKNTQNLLLTKSILLDNNSIQHIYTHKITEHSKNVTAIALMPQDYLSGSPKHESTIAVTTKKAIHWYIDDNYISSTQLMQTNNIESIVGTSDRTLIATISHANQNVILRNKNDKIITISQISSSKAREHKALFRPKSSDITFLSNRTGTDQIWLQSKEHLSQITFDPMGVNHYIWSDDGKRLSYLSNGQLWSFPIDEKPNEIITSKAILKPLQVLSNNRVLALASSGMKQQVVSISLDDGSLKTIYDGDIEWAQLINNRLLFNNKFGDMFEVDLMTEIPSVTKFKPTDDFQLQSHYLKRGDGIYIQDKSFNVLLYRPNQINKNYDSYNHQTLFITDIDPINNRLLAESFPTKTNKIVLIE